MFPLRLFSIALPVGKTKDVQKSVFALTSTTGSTPNLAKRRDTRTSIPSRQEKVKKESSTWASRNVHFRILTSIECTFPILASVFKLNGHGKTWKCSNSIEVNDFSLSFCQQKETIVFIVRDKSPKGQTEEEQEELDHDTLVEPVAAAPKVAEVIYILLLEWHRNLIDRFCTWLMFRRLIELNRRLVHYQIYRFSHPLDRHPFYNIMANPNKNLSNYHALTNK